MADDYLSQNQNLYSSTQQSLGDLDTTQAEGKNPGTNNPLQTTNSQIFATYFQERHNANGHMYTADQDDLTFVQKNQLAYYGERKIREKQMSDAGVSQANIALFRAWDDDYLKANSEGKQIDLSTMLSADYSSSAVAKYNFDETMYNKYVANSRVFTQEEYDPDGDGVLNYTEDVIKSFDGMNDEDLANTFDYMDSQQKRMLAFDGIATRDDYAKYCKGLYADYNEKHSGIGYNIGQFFKGIGHGFISAVMDLVKLPMTLVSLGYAGINWVAHGFSGNAFDNPISQSIGTADKWLDNNTTGAYDNAVSLDSDNTWAKIGGFAGQAVEIAAEVLLTGGMATVAREGGEAALKLGEKQIEKATEKVSEKAAQKAIAKGTKKVVGSGGKAIEREAINLARKEGTKKVLESHIEEAAGKVLSDTTTKAGQEAAEKAVSSATMRLAKRGVYDYSEEALAKVTSEVAAKGIGKVTEGIASKEAAKLAEKETSKTLSKQTAKNIVGKLSRKGKSVKSANKLLRKGTQTEMIKTLAEKPGVVKRVLTRTFKANDPLTKLFALKSFSSSVQDSQERGDNFLEAFGRATLAYGTTNLVWGGAVLGKEGNAISRMLTKSVGKDVKLFSSKLMSAVASNAGEVTLVAGKMWADGTIHDFIREGMRKGDDGKMNIGLMDAIKSNLTIDKIGEDFMSAFTMHATGAIARGTKQAIGKGVGKTFGRKSTLKNVLGHVDTQMNGNDGLGQEIWQGYKAKSKTILGDSASELDIIDQAATLARAEGGFVSQMVDTFYVQGSAKAYGIDVRSNIEDVAEHVDTKVKEANEHIDKLVKEYGSKSTNTMDTNFKLFQQHAIMNNANAFDGEKLPSDIKVNNWQPEDFTVAYARYKSKGLGAVGESIPKAIIDSFNESDEIKKVLGDDTFKVLSTMPFDQINTVTNRLYNPIDKDNAKNWLGFHNEVTKELNVKEPSTEKINAIIDKYEMTEQRLNQEVGKGMSEALAEKGVVVQAREKMANEIKGALSSKGGIDTYMKDLADKRFALAPEKLFESIEESAKAKRLTKDEETKALIAAYDAVKGSLEASEKEMPELKRYKLMSDANKVNKIKAPLVKELEAFHKKRISKDFEDKTSAEVTREQEEAKALVKKTTKVIEETSKISTADGFDEVWKDVTGEKYDASDMTGWRTAIRESLPTTRDESKANTQTAMEDNVIKIIDRLDKMNNSNPELQDMKDRMKTLEQELKSIKDNGITEDKDLNELPIAEKIDSLIQTVEAKIKQQDAVLVKPINNTAVELEQAPEAPVENEPIVIEEPIEEPQQEQEEQQEETTEAPVEEQETKEYTEKNTAQRIAEQKIIKQRKENNKLLEQLLDETGDNCSY